MSQLIPSTTPIRTFKDHTSFIWGAAVFPDKRRMITSSPDKTLRLWDVKTGAVLKKMEGHSSGVWGLAVSRNGQMIASGDENGEIIAWHGETGESLNQPIKAHSTSIYTLDFSPDGTVLATGSFDQMTKLWNTKTWQPQGNPIQCSGFVWCVRYSPSGKHLAIATSNGIEIYNSSTRERFKDHTSNQFSLAWTPDGKRLLSGGDRNDPTIREWDTSTWTQVGDPWKGHTHCVRAIAIHPAGTHVASSSDDTHARLWRLSDRQTIAIFQHSSATYCVTFSMNGMHILSGGYDNMISQWEAPKDILSVNATAHDACIAGDLSTAEEVFTQEINADECDYTSFANRSFIMARKHDYDHALEDATKSVAIQPSLIGYISKGIALCGKGQVQDARTAFNIAFMFTNEESKIIHFLLLIQVIALFGADQHQEAMQLVQQLAAACPDDNTLAYRVVEAYPTCSARNQCLEWLAARRSLQTTSLPLFQSSAFLSGSDHSFCVQGLGGGRLREALESHQYMMDMSDEPTKASCFDWSTAFTQECRVLCLANGDAALAASDYDRAIELYSVIIDLDFANDIIFANRSRAKSQKMLWDDAVLDAQKVIELNPSSHVGYELKHTALHAAQRYDEAIEALEMMILKLESATDTQIRKLREQYVSLSEAASAIRKVVHIQLNLTPLRLLNTATGLLCDREAQIGAFETRTEYKELLVSTMKHPNLGMEHMTEVVATYFRCTMLSHRWEGTEPLLHDVKDKDIYELNPAGGLAKLQSLCEIARKAEYHWAWMDSCCIDQTNNIEVQTSLDSMFAWYHHSALTTVYLSDVSPSSTSGALAKSTWNTRGWTVPEFLAPKVIRFYQQDWTPYLNDHSPNHKESVEIMHELESATGIEARALVAFQPGMRDARDILQWVSARVTTRPEDIAYSLFGIFGVRLPINYGENRQNAVGRLLQEIVAQSGDITALDWVGQPSTFNSCLPANISSYATPPCTLPSLSEDEIQTAVISLQNTVAVELAVKLYDQLDNTSTPRFANCRLHLPCIAFRVTELRRKSGPAQETRFTYGVKADGLDNLLITTKESLVQFSRAKPTRQTFLLVRPWDSRLLELPDFAELPALGDDAESFEEWSEPESPLDDSPGGSLIEEELDDSESHSRALRLMVRLGQPFGAFLLTRQPNGEYTRIASDYSIIAQVKDVTSIPNIMSGVRIVEIL
ncbi:uncharacterized protein EDB91DRAFT_1345292 [Suillus paluster]|uniref:uncharacterized protein n=1 Tax=Suillus paluster TaxID=48578 RepID=UPI001B886AD3|nr:uncharacterized protein EDB91DRAFT_1345292 [Suillus paluster]KAG1747253.1 hypothetical protein EDB91DRAFT_1345292 [Suillus paluster]